MFSDKEVVEKLGFEYQKIHDSMMRGESGFVLDLVSKILKLLEILDKNVTPEFKSIDKNPQEKIEHNSTFCLSNKS